MYDAPPPTANNASLFESCRHVIHGTVEPGFEEVRAAFEGNFAERGEVGAACTVVHRGRLVVDLWGGFRDPVARVPWERDTMVMVYSTTKGVAAAALVVAASCGFFSYDDPVAAHWPEFGAHGKSTITVRQLFQHEAGLPVLDGELRPEVLGDLDSIATTLAGQHPLWEPGTRHGYHMVTWGWLAAEFLRRVDPAHRTIGRFIQDEIMRPLGLQFFIGLPASEDARVASLIEPRWRDMIPVLPHVPLALLAAAANPHSLWRRALRNIRIARVTAFNDPALRRFEIPSTNGIGEPRALAVLFGELAAGGSRLGLSPPVFDEIRMTAPPLVTRDAVLKLEMAYALGFMKPVPSFSFASAAAFGSAGTGGSFAFGDPDRQLGFAYAPNQLGLYMRDDPRERALRVAAITCADHVAH